MVVGKKIGMGLDRRKEQRWSYWSKCWLLLPQNLNSKFYWMLNSGSWQHHHDWQLEGCERHSMTLWSSQSLWIYLKWGRGREMDRNGERRRRVIFHFLLLIFSLCLDVQVNITQTHVSVWYTCKGWNMEARYSGLTDAEGLKCSFVRQSCFMFLPLIHSPRSFLTKL